MSVEKGENIAKRKSLANFALWGAVAKINTAAYRLHKDLGGGEDTTETVSSAVGHVDNQHHTWESPDFPLGLGEQIAVAALVAR